MLNNFRGLFWFLVALAMWLCFAAALLPMALFDDFCGWVERKFDELSRDIW